MRVVSSDGHDGVITIAAPAIGGLHRSCPVEFGFVLFDHAGRHAPLRAGPPPDFVAEIYAKTETMC